tara:strand:- start:1925 stop:2818 length:894 start_codon:yes stop_codon:yes gene_type:complete
MITNNYIEFKKERDLGAMITDAFKFLRQEWKPFFTTIIKVSLVPVLLAVASTIYYSLSSSDFLSNVFNFSQLGTSQEANTDYGLFFIAFLIYIIFNLIAYVMVTASAMYYVKSYIDNQGKIDYYYVKSMTFKKFWSFSGLFFVTGIIVGVGSMICGLPGVYFWVVLSLSSCILVFFEKGAMDSISDAFNFIKGHWWETFGILIVIFLIVLVISFITQLPATIYQLIKMGTSTFGSEDPTEMMEIFKDPIYLALLVISEVFKFSFSTITLLVTIFVFFDINEQKNNTGAIDKIDTIGS